MTLAVRDLTVAFSDDAAPTVAVDRLSLTVDSGEVLAIVGPSGCGKSTLLRVIAGLQEPTSGAVRWNGDDLAGVPTHRRGFGLMFQSHALFAHRSVGENVAFGLRMAGQSATSQADRVRDLLELVELPGFEERSVTSLSGGEAQRVALARALAPEPSLLLLDEPLGALDRRLRSDLSSQLHAVLREIDQTAIHVTHDLDEAFDIADRIAVMNNGRILRVGAPAEVWDDPQSAFVAEFIGHSIVEIDGQRIVLRAGDAHLQTVDSESTPAIASGEVTVDAVVESVRFRRPHDEVVCRTTEGAIWVVSDTTASNNDGPVNEPRNSLSVGQDVVIRFIPSQLPVIARD